MCIRDSNITADMDYGWLDLIYRMYPNMQGVFNTENFWAGIQPPCEGSAKMLEIADRFGGFFVWSDQDHGSTVTNIVSNANMKKACLLYTSDVYKRQAWSCGNYHARKK